MKSLPVPADEALSDDILILPAGLSDLRAVRRLEKACFRREDIWPLVESLWVLTSPGMVRLKMVKSEEVIGFLSGYTLSGREVGWISSIGIAPAWQGRQLGERLLAAGEHALGTRVIRLTVRASNPPAIHLYERTGYRQIQTARGYYVGGEDGLVFEKLLSD